MKYNSLKVKLNDIIVVEKILDLRFFLIDLNCNKVVTEKCRLLLSVTTLDTFIYEGNPKSKFR
jgi:hypothetical protein